MRAAHPFRLEIHDSLPSTSDHCIAAARLGEAENLAVLARHQTAARGSRGRRWITGSNNLALSVLLRPDTKAAEAGQWSLLAGLAVIEALAPHVVPPGRLQLKWPNDILLDGAKLAGILIDTETMSAGRLAWLVIGVGVNLAAAPALPDRPTASLATRQPPETIAPAILAHLQSWRTRLHADGFGPLREAWLARAHPVGTPLTIAHPAAARAGRFAGLSPTGALLLATSTGKHTITTADLCADGYQPPQVLTGSAESQARGAAPAPRWGQAPDLNGRP